MLKLKKLTFLLFSIQNNVFLICKKLQNTFAEYSTRQLVVFFEFASVKLSITFVWSNICHVEFE